MCPSPTGNTREKRIRDEVLSYSASTGSSGFSGSHTSSTGEGRVSGRTPISQIFSNNHFARSLTSSLESAAASSNTKSRAHFGIPLGNTQTVRDALVRENSTPGNVSFFSQSLSSNELNESLRPDKRMLLATTPHAVTQSTVNIFNYSVEQKSTNGAGEILVSSNQSMGKIGDEEENEVEDGVLSDLCLDNRADAATIGDEVVDLTASPPSVTYKEAKKPATPNDFNTVTNTNEVDENDDEALLKLCANLEATKSPPSSNKNGGKFGSNLVTTPATTKAYLKSLASRQEKSNPILSHAEGGPPQKYAEIIL